MLSYSRLVFIPGSSCRIAAWNLLALAIAVSIVAESPHSAAAWACAWPAHLGSSGAFFRIWASHCSGVRIDGMRSYFSCGSRISDIFIVHAHLFGVEFFFSVVHGDFLSMASPERFCGELCVVFCVFYDFQR